MRALVVYESMYGNTHAIADAIAAGLGPPDRVSAVPVGDVKPEELAGIDLLVVGGPTHAHGMSRSSTRRSALDAARRPAATVAIDPSADGQGLREWFAGVRRLDCAAVAYDTRMRGPAVFTGRASKGIARMLRRHGANVLAGGESFFVTKDNRLVPGEAARARLWGSRLAETLSSSKSAVAL
jgi:menaquinone-dependent protoporphyrinogen IX oxidase